MPSYFIYCINFAKDVRQIEKIIFWNQIFPEGKIIIWHTNRRIIVFKQSVANIEIDDYICDLRNTDERYKSESFIAD